MKPSGLTSSSLSKLHALGLIASQVRQQKGNDLKGSGIKGTSVGFDERDQEKKQPRRLRERPKLAIIASTEGTLGHEKEGSGLETKLGEDVDESLFTDHESAIAKEVVMQIVQNTSTPVQGRSARSLPKRGSASAVVVNYMLTFSITVQHLRVMYGNGVPMPDWEWVWWNPERVTDSIDVLHIQRLTDSAMLSSASDAVRSHVRGELDRILSRYKGIKVN